ncbi:MAG TPA: hypothetical protein VFT55_13070, partial [Planctomycetota bacterium]|nr:hypothetical protein [Planctomycetota bacterium]
DGKALAQAKGPIEGQGTGCPAEVTGAQIESSAPLDGAAAPTLASWRGRATSRRIRRDASG